jgi:hypothetical protein
MTLREGWWGGRGGEGGGEPTKRKGGERQRGEKVVEVRERGGERKGSPGRGAHSRALRGSPIVIVGLIVHIV